MKKLRYRRISVRIWSDEKIRRLSPEALLVWFYILTHPNLLGFGCMRTQPEALALEVPWLFDRDKFSDYFGQLVDEGLVLVDPEASFLALPNFLTHNPPVSPNVVSGWSKVVGLVPECAARDRYFKTVQDHVADRGVYFLRALPKAFETSSSTSGGAHG